MAQTSGEATRERRIHPGAGRDMARPHPKGRQLDPANVARLDALLGGRAFRRDELIEALHLVQDAEGCLPAGLLQALAERMRLPMAEVWEVASFYAHFDPLRDGEPRPAPTTIRICDSLSCAMAGAEALIRAMQANSPAGVRVLRAPCLGACDHAPAAALGHAQIAPASEAALRKAARDGVHSPAPTYRDLAAYCAAGGYRVLADCLAGTRTRQQAIATLSDAGLRGLGGAGFPTGRKWSLVAAEPAPRLMAVNADEGEPGTFKDRVVLETDPHRMLEGMLIGAWAVEAEAVYIYLRDEYPRAREILGREIAALVAAGLAGHVAIHLRRGAGAYVCGEESAMIESIEGKRGLPRHRPPYVAQVGLFGRPTLVNNVETLAFVPDILAKGADWFAAQGKHGAKGLRSYSVSGRVRKPGVVLTGAGATARELIDLCGGMAEGQTLRAYLPGGASGGILPAHMADIPLDFGALERHGCFVGSHAVVILSDQDDLKQVARNLMRFFADESCGQCTPCRLGTEKAVALMEAPDWDGALLDELATAMREASICGLGQAAGNPLASLLRFFPEELG